MTSKYPKSDAPLTQMQTLPYREVVAVVTAYNEGDVISCAIKKLTAQGIGVYLIDNWSTDDTVEQALKFAGEGLVGWERFPQEPSPYFTLRTLLHRVEHVHRHLGARWCIHQDADEVRDSPWPQVGLRDALRHVEAEGYNTVNHVCLIFRPTDDTFRPPADFEAHFKHFELGQNPGHYVQLKMWRNITSEFNLRDSGGHRVTFAGQRVFPIPFLLKHYPIRGQAHGQRKVLVERKQRFDPAERRMGWHTQYDHCDTATNFLYDPAALTRFDEQATKRHFLQHPPTIPNDIHAKNSAKSSAKGPHPAPAKSLTPP